MQRLILNDDIDTSFKECVELINSGQVTCDFSLDLEKLAEL